MLLVKQLKTKVQIYRTLALKMLRLVRAGVECLCNIFEWVVTSKRLGSTAPKH